MRIGGGRPPIWPPPDWLDAWNDSDPIPGGTGGDPNQKSGDSGSGPGKGETGGSSGDDGTQGGDTAGDKGYSQEDTFERVKDSRPTGIDSGPNGGGSLQLPDPHTDCSSDSMTPSNPARLDSDITGITPPTIDNASLDVWDGFQIDPTIAYAGALPFEALSLGNGTDSSGYQTNQDSNYALSQAYDNLSSQVSNQGYTGNADTKSPGYQADQGQQSWSYQPDNSYVQSYQDTTYQQSYQDNSYQQSYQDNSYQQSLSQYSYQPDNTYQQNNW